MWTTVGLIAGRNVKGERRNTDSGSVIKNRVSNLEEVHYQQEYIKRCLGNRITSTSEEVSWNCKS